MDGQNPAPQAPKTSIIKWAFLFFVTAIIGLVAWKVLQKDGIYVTPEKPKNESKPFEIPKTDKPQVTVEQIKVNVQENQDVETFRRVQEKIKEKYGI